MNRRKFLQASGAAIAALAVSGCDELPVPPKVFEVLDTADSMWTRTNSAWIDKDGNFVMFVHPSIESDIRGLA